jgi:hypothetical protein
MKANCRTCGQILRRALRALPFLAAIMLAPHIAAAQTSSDMSAIYGRGVHAYFANQTPLAERYLGDVINSGSTDPRAYYFRAMARLRLGRRYEAQQDMQIGAMYEARDPGAAGWVGQALTRVQGPNRQLLESYRRQGRLQHAAQQRMLAQARYEQLRRQETEVLRQETPIELDQLAPTTGLLVPAVPPAAPPEAAPEDEATPQPQLEAEPPVEDGDDPFGVGPPADIPQADVPDAIVPEAAEAAEADNAEDPFGVEVEGEATPIEAAPADGDDPLGVGATPAAGDGDAPAEPQPAAAEATDPFGAGAAGLPDATPFEVEPTDDSTAPAEGAPPLNGAVPGDADDSAEAPAAAQPGESGASSGMGGVLGRVLGRTLSSLVPSLPSAADLGNLAPGLSPTAEEPGGIRPQPAEFELGPNQPVGDAPAEAPQAVPAPPAEAAGDDPYAPDPFGGAAPGDAAPADPAPSEAAEEPRGADESASDSAAAADPFAEAPDPFGDAGAADPPPAGETSSAEDAAAGESPAPPEEGAAGTEETSLEVDPDDPFQGL